MPAATGSLIIANVLGFLLQLVFEPSMTEAFGLWIDPESPFEQIFAAPWQLVTYAFLHGGFAHLALNMFALWMFGRDCEQVLPPKDASHLKRIMAAANNAQRMIRGLLEFARRDPCVTTVVAATSAGNAASQGVLERNGFEKTDKSDDPEDGPLLWWRIGLS